jgi:hypothetical protein
VAITIAVTPTAFSEGTTPNVDFNGADYAFVVCGAVDGDFENGQAAFTTLEFNGVAFDQWYLNAGGGDVAAGGFSVYILKAPAAGEHDLVSAVPGSGYDLGPTMLYGGLIGVNQGANHSDNVRSPTSDDTLGTSVSLTAANAEATDFVLSLIRDAFDAAHTQSGTNVFDALSTVNNETIRVGHFTNPEAAGGASGGSNMTGVIIPFIAAPEPGGAAMGHPGLVMAL